jgi:chromosome segregation ATPase
MKRKASTKKKISVSKKSTGIPKETIKKVLKGLSLVALGATGASLIHRYRNSKAKEPIGNNLNKEIMDLKELSKKDHILFEHQQTDLKVKCEKQIKEIQDKISKYSDILKQEINDLKKEINSLEQENGKLKKDNDILIKDVSSLKAVISKHILSLKEKDDKLNLVTGNVDKCNNALNNSNNSLNLCIKDVNKFKKELETLGNKNKYF